MKTFAVRYASIKSSDNEFIGGYETNRHRQGTILIQAKFKKDALAKMDALGYKVPPAECTVAMGNDLDALLAADAIDTESAILISSNHPEYVARVWFDEEGERHAQRLGELVRDEESRTHARKLLPVVGE